MSEWVSEREGEREIEQVRREEMSTLAVGKLSSSSLLQDEKQFKGSRRFITSLELRSI
jgi:hypothetical protein